MFVSKKLLSPDRGSWQSSFCTELMGLLSDHPCGKLCYGILFSLAVAVAVSPTLEYDRYILNLTLSDQTGKTWVTAFNDMAEPLLGGKTANELYEMKGNSEVRGKTK